MTCFADEVMLESLNETMTQEEEYEKKPAYGKRKKEIGIEEEKKQTQRAKKKPRATKPKEEPQYFEGKRNLEDLWKVAFPVGTEWDNIDKFYEWNWDFKNLEESLEEGGKLYGKKVFVFGCDEPQCVPYRGFDAFVHVPAVVVIESPFPPSDKLGITSVQKEVEEIIPMKKMKMDWLPYTPVQKRTRQVEKIDFQIFTLGCIQRRSALRHMKEVDIKKFNYCLPYFYHPFKEDENELEEDTVIPIMFPSGQGTVICDFDYEFDELEGLVEKKVEEEEITSEEKDEFKEFVKERVRAARKANREAKVARKKEKEEMSEETKEAFEKMKFYKFYPRPSPDTPDISGVKERFINRYYGKAHEVL